MDTFTAPTPKYVLEAINALNISGLGMHSVIDVDASASGEMLRAETIVQPGGGGGPLHRHRFQEERFEILEGEIIGCIGRTRRRVRAGQTFVAPPDAPHTFLVEADEPARFITEFRPGLRLAEFFAQIFWLADRQQIDNKGRIHPLQAALLARTYPQEFFYLPTIPAALQQAIARPLAALARRRGYSPDPAGLANLTAPDLSHDSTTAQPTPERPNTPPQARTRPANPARPGSRGEAAEAASLSFP